MVTQGKTMNSELVTTRRTELMHRWLNPAAFVLFGYVVLTVLIFWIDLPLVRVPLAIALVLFGSGYSLVTVLFPGSSYLDWMEKLALAGGLSLAVGGIVGFALANLTWGLAIDSVLITAILFNTICYLVIVYQRRRATDSAGSEVNDWLAASFIWVPKAKRYRDAVSGRWVARTKVSLAIEHTLEAEKAKGFTGGLKRWAAGQSPSNLVITGALILIIALGVWTFDQAARGAAKEPAMTEFYLLNENNLAEDFPVEVRPNQTFSIHYGIVNREGQTVSYHVEAVVAGETIGKSTPATLGTGETLQNALFLEWPDLGAAAMPGSEKVEFILYREAQPYRTLHLWLDVTLPQTTTTVRDQNSAPESLEQVSQ